MKWVRSTSTYRFVRRICFSASICFFINTSLINTSTAAAAPLYLDVLVNGQAKNVILPFTVEKGGRFSTSLGELRKIGLKFEASRLNEDRIGFGFQEDLKAVYDEPSQSINLIVTDAYLEPTRVDGRGATFNLEPPRPSDVGAVVNYLAFASGDAGNSSAPFSSRSLYLDAKTFSSIGSFKQTGYLGQTPANETFATRLDTAFTTFNRDTATRETAGDFISIGANWARPIRMFGVQMGTDFTLRPDLVSTALPSFSGTAAVPTTLDVYVNNVRTLSRSLPPGPYTLANIPGLSGSGTAEIVTRDASGREQRLFLPFFASASLLKTGASEFGVQAGFARYYYAVSNFTYGSDPLAIATWRRGVTDRLTVQAHGETGAGLVNLGGGATFSAFDLATVTLGQQVSTLSSQMGTQSYGALDTTLGPFHVFGSSQYSFGHYDDLVSATARPSSSNESFGFVPWDTPFNASNWTEMSEKQARPPISLQQISVSTPGPVRGSQIGLNYALIERESSDLAKIIGVNYSQSINPWLSFYGAINTDLGTNASTVIAFGVNGTFDGLSYSGTSSMSGSNAVTKRIALSREPNAQTKSIGWMVDVGESGGVSDARASVSYLGSAARLGASAQVSQTTRWASVEAEGAFAMIGPDIVASNRIDDAFALVSTGQPNIEVLSENRSLGKTDANGRILVPSLVPFQSNTIAINPAGLPASISIDKTEEHFIPSRNAAYQIDFSVKGMSDLGRSAFITALDSSGAPLPAGTIGHIERTHLEIVVGQDGELWANDLREGDVAIIKKGDQTCRFAFHFDRAFQAGFIERLGTTKCQ